MLDPYLGRIGHQDFFGVCSSWQLRGPKIILQQNKMKSTMHMSEVSLSRMLRNSRMSATHFACIAYVSNVKKINIFLTVIINNKKMER